MKKGLILTIILAVLSVGGSVAQSGYDDIYMTGEDAAKKEKEIRKEQEAAMAAAEQYGDSNSEYLNQARSYGNDGEYIDYEDDDYYYARNINRFYNPYYTRGYYSMFNNPYWYNPYWVDPYWGWSTWNSPYYGWGGGPYWSGYSGWYNWYGYSGFNSCYNYPYYVGYGYGGYGGYYSGYWNGYYAGLYNGYYYGNYGNGYGGRSVSYGPRYSVNHIKNNNLHAPYNGVRPSPLNRPISGSRLGVERATNTNPRPTLSTNPRNLKEDRNISGEGIRPTERKGNSRTPINRSNWGSNENRPSTNHNNNIRVNENSTVTPQPVRRNRNFGGSINSTPSNNTQSRPRMNTPSRSERNYNAPSTRPSRSFQSAPSHSAPSRSFSAPSRSSGSSFGGTRGGRR